MSYEQYYDCHSKHKNTLQFKGNGNKVSLPWSSINKKLQKKLGRRFFKSLSGLVVLRLLIGSNNNDCNFFLSLNIVLSFWYMSIVYSILSSSQYTFESIDHHNICMMNFKKVWYTGNSDRNALQLQLQI